MIAALNGHAIAVDVVAALAILVIVAAFAGSHR